MKVTKSDVTQSILYKSMRSFTFKSRGIMIFLTAIFWLTAWFSSIVFLIPAIYFAYRLFNDCVKTLKLSKLAMCELEAEDFSELQKQASNDENRNMFGIVTDHGIIVNTAFIPYESIETLRFMPKKWRWDGVLLGFGLRSSPAYLSVTYSINTPSGKKTNKKLKNLPTNRDISKDIEEFAATVTSHPNTKITVHNEYHFVN